MTQNKKDTIAVIIGGGSIGSALVEQLRSAKEYGAVVVCGRSCGLKLDLLDELSIANAAISG